MSPEQMETAPSEDKKVKRICAATSIEGCILSLITFILDIYPFDDIHNPKYPEECKQVIRHNFRHPRFVVHEFNVDDSVVVAPSSEEVFDQKYTSEKWITSRAESKVIGELVITDLKVKEHYTKHGKFKRFSVKDIKYILQ